MLKYEAKKVFGKKSILFFLVVYLLFCSMFMVQMYGVKNARDTAKLIEQYSEIEGVLGTGNKEKIIKEKQKMDEIFELEYEMEEAYRVEKIDSDEFLAYRDEYHKYYNKEEVIEYLYNRYITEGEKWNFVLFDGYYNQLFSPDRTQWGLLISCLIFSILLCQCENERLNNVLKTTQSGYKNILIAKAKLCIIFSFALTLGYMLSEIAIYLYYHPLQHVLAPVQNVSCLNEAGISINILWWMILTTIIRGMALSMVTVVLFGIWFLAGPKKTTYILAVLIIISLLLDAGFGYSGVDIISRVVTVYDLFL